MNLVELDRALPVPALRHGPPSSKRDYGERKTEKMAPPRTGRTGRDELQRRQDSLLDRRHKLARFRDPHHRMLDTFDLDFQQEEKMEPTRSATLVFLSFTHRRDNSPSTCDRTASWNPLLGCLLHVIKMLPHSVYMRGKMGARVFVLTGCACLLTTAQASAGTLLADRATLEALLGPTAITEDFEAFDFVGPILNLSSPVDSSTAPIVNGVAFSGVGTGLRITDQSNVGRTQELGVVGSGDFSLLIDFSEPTDAFGLTFFPFVLVGTDVTVNVFAPDDNTLLQSHTVTAFFNFGQFIGVHELGGIGSVSVSAIAAPPLDFVRDFHIDQLTFGSRPSVSVPEPATTVLLIVGVAALGAVRRSRRHRM